MRRVGRRGADNQSPNFYELDFIFGANFRIYMFLGVFL